VHVAHPFPPEVPHTSIIVPVTSELCTQTSLELVQTVPVGVEESVEEVVEEASEEESVVEEFVEASVESLLVEDGVVVVEELVVVVTEQLVGLVATQMLVVESK